MNLTFAAHIQGREIHCDIGSDVALASPLFCFSLMAAPRVVSGGVMGRRLAGYGEVALPDIPAGTVHRLILAYDNPDYTPKNRAWLPLGAYLRLGKQAYPLPEGFDLGVRPSVLPVPAPLPTGALPLIPPPHSWRPAMGHLPFTALRPNPAYAGADALAQRMGLAPLLAETGFDAVPKIDVGLGPDAYDITITPQGIAITAGDAAGVHYGAITLLTLRQTCGGALPCGTLTDSPRFVWRGQHLDCARHFFAVDSILLLLDLMALLKLNRFHWHLTDDEAFRLHLTCAPDLARKTALRGEGQLMLGVFGGGIKSGGSYSHADVARVLAHAARLHIHVLPEIEIPAHAHAMIQVMPALRDAGDNGAEVSVQGYIDNIINPAVPATWDILPQILDEVAGLFPMGMIHLGCDEAPHGAWAGSPAVRALMVREGLATSDDVQGWMMARLAGHLADKGIRAAAWEEAAKGAQGGIGKAALLFSWTGQGPGVAAARAGYDVVMCPAKHTYFDLAHSDDPDDWGARWAGILPLDQSVDWDPIPADCPDIAPRVLGVQGCFWGEFTTDDSQAQAMIAPRIFGLACKAWEARGTTTPAQLRALVPHYAPLLATMGWAMGPLGP